MHLLLPAAFAGIVAVGATVAIERLGGRLGGLLATLPTTIVPASLGIWAQSASVADFQHAMAGVPAGMLLNAGFLWLWRVVPPHLPAVSLAARLTLMSAVGIGAWFAGALTLVWGQQHLATAGALWWTGAFIAATTPLIGAAACLRPLPAPRGGNRVGPVTLAARGLFAAAAIGVAVWLTTVGGPIAAAVASVFPAIFLTTMVSVWLSQGEAVQAGAVGPMMLGSGAVSAHAMFAGLAIPALGPALGTPVAWGAAVLLVTVPGWRFLEWRRSLLPPLG
ncbi:MAG: hypothetical protein ACI8PZ_005600 [Myxococcota bacterium]|jgi:hypothetical protein